MATNSIDSDSKQEGSVVFKMICVCSLFYTRVVLYYAGVRFVIFPERGNDSLSTSLFFWETNNFNQSAMERIRMMHVVQNSLLHTRLLTYFLTIDIAVYYHAK